MSGKRFVVLFLFLLVLAPHASLAYMDPGSGSIVLQAIIAGATGALVLARLFWKRLVGLFRPRREPGER